jgi:hypothetical protein
MKKSEKLCKDINCSICPLQYKLYFAICRELSDIKPLGEEIERLQEPIINKYGFDTYKAIMEKLDEDETKSLGNFSRKSIKVKI